VCSVTIVCMYVYIYLYFWIYPKSILSTKVLSLCLYVCIRISLVGINLNDQKIHELKVTILHMYLLVSFTFYF
jgi:hypothetical protein